MRSQIPQKEILRLFRLAKKKFFVRGLSKLSVSPPTY